MELPEKDLENRFSYHAPSEYRRNDLDQQERYELIRYDAKMFAKTLNDYCPDSRELSLAMTNLEQAVMWANASIARNE